MGEFLTWILDSIQTVDAHTRALIAMIGALLEANVVVGLLIPGDTAVVLAAMAVETPMEGVVLGLLVAVGSSVGMASSYGLGRWFGPRAASSWLARWIGRDRWLRAERFLERRGSVAVFLSRFVPVFRTVVPFLVGVGRLSLRKFLISASSGSLLWAAGYVVVLATASEQLGSLVGAVPHGGPGPLVSEEALGAALVALVVLSVLVGLFVRWRWTSRSTDGPRKYSPRKDWSSFDES